MVMRSVRFERSHVDAEAVLHIGLEQLLVGFVDLLDGDDLDIGGDVVVPTKVKHLLGLAAIPPMGEPERLRRPNRKVKGGDGERLFRRTDEREIAVPSEQIEVGVNVVIGGDRVEDEVELLVCSAFLSIAGDNDLIGAEAKRVPRLAG